MEQGRIGTVGPSVLEPSTTVRERLALSTRRGMVAIAAWAVLCGALASGRASWTWETFGTLGLLWALALLGWGRLWEAVSGTDWAGPLLSSKPLIQPVSLWVPPYTQPASPAGRLACRLGGWLGRWRETIGPALRPALADMLGAAALSVVVALLLPVRLGPLHLAMVALLALAVTRAWRGRMFWAGQALVRVGLSWLAGHLAFAEITGPSLLLALSLTGAAWGFLRAVGPAQISGRPAGVWLWNSGQILGVVLLVVARQPLAAGAVGLLLLSQVAIQPSLSYGIDQPSALRRTWPWLMAAMAVAALAIS